MELKPLSTSYLIRLTVANHDGVTQQILDRLTAYQTSNTLLQQAVASVQAARQAEDLAYRRTCGKDFTSDDLRETNRLMGKYMVTMRGILKSLTGLPADEPLRRKAQLAFQLFKDFQYSSTDGIEAEARKTLNMVQQWRAAEDYTLEELRIDWLVTKSDDLAKEVNTLIAQRVNFESSKVKGELAAARKQTDAAIRKAYEVLNALILLEPSPALRELISLLLSIEERAKLYYISTGKSNAVQPENGSGGTSSASDAAPSSASDKPDATNVAP